MCAEHAEAVHLGQQSSSINTTKCLSYLGTVVIGIGTREIGDKIFLTRGQSFSSPIVRAVCDVWCTFCTAGDRSEDTSIIGDASSALRHYSLSWFENVSQLLCSSEPPKDRVA